MKKALIVSLLLLNAVPASAQILQDSICKVLNVYLSSLPSDPNAPLESVDALRDKIGSVNPQMKDFLTRMGDNASTFYLNTQELYRSNKDTFVTQCKETFPKGFHDAKRRNGANQKIGGEVGAAVGEPPGDSQPWGNIFNFERKLSRAVADTEHNKHHKGASQSESPYCPQPICLKGDILSPAILNASASICETVKISVPGNSEEIKFPAKNPSCTCLQQKYQSKNCYIPSDVASGIDNKRKQIKKSIYRQFGKKYLNQYSKLIEDSYYLDKRLDAYKGVKDKRAYQCIEFDKLKRDVADTCGRRRNDVKDLDARINAVFNAVGGNGPNQHDIHDMMKNNYENIIKLSETAPNGKKFDRAQYDVMRQAFSLSEKPYNFIKDVMDKAVSSEEFSQKIKNDKVGQAPYVHLVDVLTEESLKNPDAFITKYLDKSKMGDEAYNKYVSYLKKSKEEQLSEPSPFTKDIGAMIAINPLYYRTFHNKGTFDKKFSEAKKTGIPLSKAIDTGSNEVIIDQIKDECQMLNANMVKTICMPDDEFFDKVSVKDAEELLGITEQQPGEADEVAMAYCMEGTDPTELKQSRSEFAYITNAPGNQSDFYNNMTSGVANNSFRKVFELMTSKDDNSQMFADHMNNALSNAAPFIKPMESSSSNDESFLMSYIGQRNPTLATSLANGSQVSTEKFKEVATAGTSTEQTISTGGQQGQTQNTQGDQNLGAAPPVIAGNYSNAGSQVAGDSEARKDLRDALSNDSNRDTIDKLMSNLDEASIRELAKYKDDAAKKREQQIEAMKLENDKLLSQLQEQMASLQKQREEILTQTQALNKPAQNTRAPASVNPGPAQNSSTLEKNGSSSGGMTGGSEFVPTQSTNFVQSQNTGGGASVGGSAGGSSSGSTAGAGSLGRADSGNLAAANLVKYGGLDNGGPVPVSSGQVKSAGLEIKSADVNSEVLKFIQEGSPDIRTLLQIKESGMVYKYKVMENGKEVEREMVLDYNNLTEDVKKLIEQKIAKSGVDKKEIARIDSEIKLLKRRYSYQALKSIIAEQTKR